MNMLVMELKSEALKERHWRQMMKELRVNWNLSDLTLGQVGAMSSWSSARFDSTFSSNLQKFQMYFQKCPIPGVGC